MILDMGANIGNEVRGERFEVRGMRYEVWGVLLVLV